MEIDSRVFKPEVDTQHSTINREEPKLVEDYYPCFKGKVDSCSGSVSSKTPLDKIGLTKKELKVSVYCIAADFDNNGSMDFAIWGARHSRLGW